jgi:flagellar L-ring protein precursor FlgH
MLARLVFLGALFWLAGCVGSPPTNVHQPMTARPVEHKPVVYADGAIFHAGVNERPLFEDRRARNVGDILTINVVEKTTANRQSTGTSSTANSVNANTPTVTTGTGTLSKLLLSAFSVTSSSDNSTSSASAGTGSEDLTGVITVTVIEAMANGNLLVSGEKQVGINGSDEYIRFSGVVNPTTITAANTVQSNQVADARIEYRSAGSMREVVNDAQTLGFLGRFFMSVLPF